MISNLRQGSQLYLIHKSASTPFVEMGSVESTNNMVGYFPTMPTMPVTLSVRCGEKVTTYQNLPPNAEAADATNRETGETVTIACTKEAANAEVQSMRQKSIEAINSVEYHRQRIAVCDSLIQQLNPEQAEKAQQQKEMNELRGQVSDLSALVRQLTMQLKGSDAEEETSGSVINRKE